MPVPHRPHPARGSEARVSATLGEGRHLDAAALRPDGRRFGPQIPARGREGLGGAHVSAGRGGGRARLPSRVLAVGSGQGGRGRVFF